MTQNQLPQIISDLIARFDRNLDAYRSQAYNETQLRQEFINPFFEALGWDVSNKAGHAEAYKDLVHEDAIKIGGTTKAPDYCFRIGGARKFFLEAKKPAVNIKDDPDPAYQLRRYAWSAKLPLSVLTDFEEFAVYDCRIRPSSNDKPTTGRLIYLTYNDYPTRWDELAAILSKQAVLQGAFDKFAVSERKRGTVTVDAQFLTEIEEWRAALARNLALRNPKLTVRDLNFAVQRTIDRIVFLRICEDGGIEPLGQLQALLNGENVYGRLRHLYRLADERYNSGLFHFREEKGRNEAPDALTPTLVVDDKTLKDVIHRLYPPESPYEFSVLPVEILGHVYEQFLGKVIRLTPGHRAVVEEKPEVKKAGGVYYTPAYIVDYIVEHTAGRLCQGKTPKQIAKLRILDPACGSGSFLIGAYRYLLDYHRDWYLNDGAVNHTKEIYQGPGGQWYLTPPEKKRILLNNIYGVDIDSRAVEVTKLSLLLKVLEGENTETLKRQLSIWRERALPDLGSNIKCGNSLIGPDHFSSQLLPDEEAMRRINAFDWNTEFGEILRAGGFDAVVGNPPYVRIQTMKEWAPVEVEAYKKLYSSASRGNYDVYVVFVEKGLRLLNKGGRLGFILPNKFFQAQYGEPLRRLIANGRYLEEVVHLGDQQVFEGATTYTCVLLLNKAGSEKCRVVKVKDLAAWRNTGKAPEGSIQADKITDAEWNFAVGRGSELFDRLRSMPSKLGDVAVIFVGLQTSADDVFIMDLVDERPRTLRLRSKALAAEWTFEKGLLFPMVSGTDVNRYHPLPVRQYVLFPYEADRESAKLIDFAKISSEFPKTAEYLVRNKRRLEGREEGKGKGPQWYGYIYLKNMTRQSVEKLCVPRLVRHLYAAYDRDGNRFLDNVDVGGITLRPQYVKHDLLYLLGLLNSSLLRWFFPRVSAPFRGGWLSANRQFLTVLPIRTIDFTDASDRDRHGRMLALVEQMQEFHRRTSDTKHPDDWIRLQRQIEMTDQQIDRLVYELYGLTEVEIASLEETGENAVDAAAAPSSGESFGSAEEASPLAEAAQQSSEGGGNAPSSATRSRRRVDGVRERTGDYGSPQEPTQEPESESGQVGSTRVFDTAEGTLSYTQVAERLAVALVGVLDEMLQSSPEDIGVTPDWLCGRHRTLAAALFPEWAGRYRDVNVRVGAHTPPPFNEVPVFTRLFCDDLAERLRHVRPREEDPSRLAELLAWVDWRFQWIHPFRDFNGRIGRVLLAAALYKLALPHVQTAPVEPSARQDYLAALRAADDGDLTPLTRLWIGRLAEAL